MGKNSVASRVLRFIGVVIGMLVLLWFMLPFLVAGILNIGTAPGQTAIWLLPTFYVRELYAILAEWIF